MKPIFQLLIVSLVLIIPPVAAQTAAEADSLRVIGQYDLELALREKLAENFDLKLARLRAWSLEHPTVDPKETFQTLQPKTSEQQFWKTFILGQVYHTLENHNEALNVFLSLNPKKGSLEKALVKHALAQHYMQQEDYLSAIECLEKTIAAFEECGQANHYLMGQALSDLAFSYDECGIRNKTIVFADKALKLLIRYYPRAFSIISTSHNNFLFYLMDYGDEKKVREVHQSYENYMTKFLNEKHLYTSEDPLHITHAEALFRLSDLRYHAWLKNEKNTIDRLERMELFYSKAPKKWVLGNLDILSAAYESVQLSFRRQRNRALALQYAHMIDKAEQQPYNKMKKYAAFALTYYDAKEYEQALAYVNRCLSSMEFSPKSRSFQTLKVLQTELLARMGKVGEARNQIKVLFETVLGPNNDIRHAQLEQFPEHVNMVFIDLLIHSAWTFENIYLNDGWKEEDRLMVRHLYHLAAKVFEKYYQNGIYNAQLGGLLDQLEDGLFSTLRPLTEGELASDLNLIENISHAHLWSRFSEKYYQNLKLPSVDIDRKNHLQLQRNLLARTYEKELRNQQAIREIDKALAEIEQKLIALSPEYANMNKAAFDIRKVQETLKPGETIVKYTVGKERVYGHTITRDQIALKVIGASDKIKAYTEQYLKDLKDIKHPSSSLEEILQQMLIDSLDLHRASSLLFISEDFLSYLPFEILLKQSKPVSYGFSFRNLLLTQSPLSRMSGNLAGFVPEYRDGSRVSALPYSVSELENIRRRMGSTSIYAGKSATKKTFLESLGKYKLHHLAMHSEMDEDDYEQSSLLFEGGEKLFFHELYALNFPSEMVVLSACNTGLGKYLSGEGVMSLARALTYAGVRSSVASLWQVPDKESAELMTLFYDYLAKGLTKDEALMRAKQTFVNTYPMKTHPYYWAGFILTGDTAPVQLRRTPIYVWALALLLPAFLVLIAKRKRWF